MMLTLLMMLVNAAPLSLADERTVDHAAFDALLRDVVRDERIDYLSVRDRHWTSLESYLDRLAAVEPDQLAHKREKLAYYFNLYNATMIHTIAKRYRQGYSASENDWGVFKEDLVRVGDKRFSLNHLENEILRPNYNEPRLHVALVCGARSCPPILPRAYRAADLDEVLDQNMRRFVADSFRNSFDEESKKAELSQIFNWYAVDFGGQDALLDYLAGYTDRDLKGYSVSFKEYSWELNDTAPRKGSWVEVKSRHVMLAKEPGSAKTHGSAQQGDVFSVVQRKGDWTQVRLGQGLGEAWIENRHLKSR